MIARVLRESDRQRRRLWRRRDRRLRSTNAHYATLDLGDGWRGTFVLRYRNRDDPPAVLLPDRTPEECIRWARELLQSVGWAVPTPSEPRTACVAQPPSAVPGEPRTSVRAASRSEGEPRSVGQVVDLPFGATSDRARSARPALPVRADDGAPADAPSTAEGGCATRDPLIRIEHATASDLWTRIRWTLFGTPLRRRFEQSCKLRHRDQPAEPVAAVLEHRAAALIRGSLLVSQTPAWSSMSQRRGALPGSGIQ